MGSEWWFFGKVFGGCFIPLRKRGVGGVGTELCSVPTGFSWGGEIRIWTHWVFDDLLRLAEHV